MRRTDTPPAVASYAPPAGSAPTRDHDAQLVRALGVRQLTAVIVNYTVGSGIFVLPALAVAQLGSAAPLAYLLCALCAGLVVLLFAEAGSRVASTGGAYAYVERALGPALGLVTGVLLAVGDVTALAAVASVLAGSLGRIAGIESAVVQAALIVALIGGLVAFNVRGVRSSARLVELATLAKLVPLLFFVVVGAFYVSGANLRWTGVPSARAVASTTGVLLFAFTGIESALLPSGEVRDNARTVPLATMLALGVTTLLYLAIQTVALGVAGASLASDTVTPLATTAGTFAGSAGRGLVLAGATISMFGWMSGSVFAGPRSIFALARAGFLPARLAAVHPVRRTPHVAIVAYGAIAIALALSGSFAQLAVLSNLAAFGVYALVAIALPVLRRRNVQDGGLPFLVRGGPTVPLLACAVLAWIAMETVTRREVIAFAVLIALTLAAYLLRQRKMVSTA